MNIFKNNTVYLVLALLAIVLIGITVGLQIVILSSPAKSPPATLDDRTAATTGGQNGAAVVIPAATNTPVMIVVQPTAMPIVPTVENQNTEAVVAETATAVVPTEAVLAVQAAEALSNPARIMVDAENVTISQDDDVRMTVVTNDPFAIGFFDHPYYAQHNEDARAIALQLDGGRVVEPNVESAMGGTYPLARPLYIYSSAADIQQKPQVEAFLGCYLNRINTEILQTGYFPADQFLFTAGMYSFEQNCALCRKDGVLPACTLDDIPAAPIDIVGSSTVYPITQHMADLFTASGFGGEIRMEPIETGAGISRFCEEGIADIVDADRSIQAHEMDACRAIGREPLAFPIGTDAITLVVSRDNTFIDHLTLPELQAVFVTAKTWADVRSGWPNEPIKRIIPSEQSDSLDFFANRLYTEDGRQAFVAAANAIALTPAVDTPESITAQSAVAENAVPEQAPSATPTFVVPTSTPPLAEPTATLAASQPVSTPLDPLLPGFDYSAEASDLPPFDYILAWAPERPECLLATQIVQKVIHQNYGLRFVAERYNDLPEMYADFKSVDGAALQRISLCYSDPTDRKYLAELSSWMSFIGSSYRQEGSQRWLVVAHSHVINELPGVEPCLFQFFKQLDFGEGPIDPPDVDSWLAAHPDRVAEWLRCE